MAQFDAEAVALYVFELAAQSSPKNVIACLAGLASRLMSWEDIQRNSLFQYMEEMQAPKFPADVYQHMALSVSVLTAAKALLEGLPPKNE